MVITDFLRALGQIADPRFLRVVLMGVALAAALLVMLTAGVMGLAGWLTPDSFALPFLGEVGGLDAAAALGSVAVMMGASVFLMMPVAALFSGLFLEQVVDAVEDRHYAALPPAQPVGLGDALIDAVNLFGLLIAANLLALLLYPFAGPLVPVVFWGVNGLLLGREYFTLVAMRRLGRTGAKALRARHSGQIWLAGALMAAPLSVPLLNLVVPVLGVATFTHLFHRLNRA